MADRTDLALLAASVRRHAAVMLMALTVVLAHVDGSLALDACRRRHHGDAVIRHSAEPIHRAVGMPTTGRIDDRFAAAIAAAAMLLAVPTFTTPAAADPAIKLAQADVNVRIGPGGVRGDVDRDRATIPRSLPRPHRYRDGYRAYGRDRCSTTVVIRTAAGPRSGNAANRD